MMPLRSSFLGMVSLFLLYSAAAQGTFQNRGFESANLPAIPAGQYGDFVPFSTAFPFWTGYEGTNVMTQAFHNGETLSAPSISILGPNWPSEQILTGHYSALLHAGLDPFHPVDVALAQVGTLPVGVQYLSLKASGGQVSVSFDGQDISLFPASRGSNYILYEGDISRFAGQAGELRISSEPTSLNPYNIFILDSINFVPIPEPGVLALWVLGAACFFIRLRRKGP